MSAGCHILKIISNPLHTPKVAADNYPKEKECMCVYIFQNLKINPVGVYRLCSTYENSIISQGDKSLQVVTVSSAITASYDPSNVVILCKGDFVPQGTCNKAQDISDGHDWEWGAPGISCWGCCYTSRRAQDSPRQKGITGPKTSIMPRLRYSKVYP